MASVPANLTDEQEWSDEKLDQLRLAATIEQERRAFIRTAPQQAEQQASQYQNAIGRKGGDPWVQPQNALDAYKLGAIVTDAGKTWESTVANNVWKPPVNWREKAEEGAAPPPYRQPTGSTDAYKKGDRVAWTDGFVYESNRDGNVWSPADLPSAWKKI